MRRVGQRGGVGLSFERGKGRGELRKLNNLFIYVFNLFIFIYLIIYLNLTNLQKHSIHIYIKVARQIG